MSEFGQSVFFGSPVVRARQGVRMIDEPVEIRQVIINELSESVTVVLRNGLPFCVKGRPRAAKRQLIVRYEVTLHGDARNETANLLDQITAKAPAMMRHLKKAYEQTKGNYGPSQDIVISLEYVITREDFRQYGNSLYHHGLDMWMSTVDTVISGLHPYSEEGMLQACLWNNTPEPVKGGGALFAVEIVDNAGSFGDRYLNIANEIYPVRAKKDPRRTDGLYLTRTHPSEGELGSGEIKAGYVPFLTNDGKEFDFTTMHLYRTYIDAKTLGDIASVRKEELAQMEHQLQLGKRELEGQKQQNTQQQQQFDVNKLEWDAKLLERDRRNKELQAERDRLDHELTMERMRAKDHFEDRSSVRKDSSEIVKLLPAILLAVVALATTVLNLAKKT